MIGEPFTAGAARRMLLGSGTTNPGPVANVLLGARLRRAIARKAKQPRSPVHRKLLRRRSTANPAPVLAALGALKGLGGISRRLKGPDARHAERVATFQEWARRALLGDAEGLTLLTNYIAGTGPKRARDAAALILAEVNKQLDEKEREEQREARGLTAAERRREEERMERRETRFLSAAQGVASTVGQALLRGGRRPRLAGGLGRAAGVSSRAAGVGATAAGAGAAATAAVVIGGLAAGALIGTLLRRQFGTARAVRAETVAVEGALALRRARSELEAELGRRLTAAETRKLFGAYEAQLVELGFQQNPTTGQWSRPRSAIERILG